MNHSLVNLDEFLNERTKWVKATLVYDRPNDSAVQSVELLAYITFFYKQREEKHKRTEKQKKEANTTRNTKEHEKQRTRKQLTENIQTEKQKKKNKQRKIQTGNIKTDR